MKHCYYLTFKEVIDCHLIPLGTWTQLTVPLLPLPSFVTVGFTPRRGGQSGFPFRSSFHHPSHLPNLLLTLSQNCLFCLWSTFLRPNGTFFNDRPFLFFLFRVNFSMAKRSIFQLTRTTVHRKVNLLLFIHVVMTTTRKSSTPCTISPCCGNDQELLNMPSPFASGEPHGQPCTKPC